MLKHEYRKGMNSLNTVAAAIARVRAWRVANDLAPSRFAAAAGVSEATLRQIDHENWNPTSSTLEKLEAVLPPGWQIGDPVPAALPRKPSPAAKARAA